MLSTLITSRCQEKIARSSRREPSVQQTVAGRMRPFVANHAWAPGLASTAGGRSGRRRGGGKVAEARGNRTCGPTSLLLAATGGGRRPFRQQAGQLDRGQGTAQVCGRIAKRALQVGSRWSREALANGQGDR